MNRVFSVKGIIEITEKYISLKLSRSAAALSYFLIITLFPMLISAQWILSALGEDIIAFLEGYSALIPSDVLVIIEEYLLYAKNPSKSLLIIGIGTAIYTGAAAFRTFSGTVRDIFDSRGGNETARYIFSYLYAVAFLAAIYVLTITVVAGRWLINLLEPFFAFSEIESLPYIANLWNWLRFVILNVVSTGMLYTIYYCSAWRSPYRINVLPGAVFCSLVFTVVSGLFSWFITYSVKYSAVYGSLASVIILMLWLYILANIILIGALINKEISNHRSDPKMKMHRNISDFIKKQQ